MIKRKIVVFFTLLLCLLVKQQGFCQAPCAKYNLIWSIAESSSVARDLSYRNLNDSTYEITIKILYNCKGPLMDSDMQNEAEIYCTFDTCNYTIFSGGGNVFSYIADASPNNLPDGRPNYSKILGNYCSSFPCRCDSPYNINNLIGYKERWYVDTVILPENCGLWTIRNTLAQRDTFNTNIALCVPYSLPLVPQHTNLPNMCLNLEINHLPGIKNNSPVPTNPLPVYVCENQAFSYNPGFIDPDGDSLVHTLINPLYNNLWVNVGPQSYIQQFNLWGFTNIFDSIPYTPPYSRQEPFASNGTFQFNNADGSMSFTPLPNQNPIIATRTDEYRNGVWVGSCMREYAFITINCNNSNQASNISIIPNTVQNGSISAPTEITACQNQLLSACFAIANPDPTSELKVSSNITQAIPGSTISYTAISKDSLLACITWLPQDSNVGKHTFTFSVTDTSCKAPGVSVPYTYGFTIRVLPRPELGTSTTICEGDSILIAPTNATLYQFSWSNASNTGNFSTSVTSNFASITAYPTVSDTYYYTAITLGGVCVFTDSAKVHVVQDFTLNATDTLICGQQDTASLFAYASGQNTELFYNWTPNAGILSNASQSLVFVTPATTSYVVSVTDSAACFVHTDTASIIYDGAFAPMASASPNAICADDTIVLGASGGVVTWAPIVNIANNTLTNTLAWPDAPITYTATIQSNNSSCQAKIGVPIAVTRLRADAGNDTTIRDGDLVQLGGVNMLCDTGCLHFWYDDINLLLSNNIHYNLYPIARPPQDMSFRLRLVSADGACADEDVVNIKVSCNNADIPNAFMPDNPNVADEDSKFGVRNNGLVNFTMRIYNRWGEEVFYTDNCQARWNGKYKGKPCPMGTYVYLIMGNCANGTPINRNGNVTLIR